MADWSDQTKKDMDLTSQEAKSFPVNNYGPVDSTMRENLNQMYTAPMFSNNAVPRQVEFFGYAPPTNIQKDGSGQQTSNSHSQIPPVLGWLVCVEGPDIGRHFPFFKVKNSIGRSNNCAISLSDMRITSGAPFGAIIYDSLNNEYFFTKGDSGANEVARMNDKPILGPVSLKVNDRIKIGDTLLIFVPVCTDQFSWENPDSRTASSVQEEGNQ